MLKINFTEKEREEIRHERDNNPHPRVRRKMAVLELKAEGLSHEQIAKIMGICQNTLLKYFREYQEGGLERVKEIRFHRPQSELSQYDEQLKEYFEKNPPASATVAAAAIEKETGIKRSEGRVRKYLKKLGLKKRKVGMIPGKANEEQQEKFKKEELMPRLEAAKSGARVVYFVDAAHFVLQPFLGYIWTFCRLFIKAPSGRQRLNVLGAIEAITHKLVTVCNDSYINSESVCELLWKIAELEYSVPVTLVLDNARYQKSMIVRELAELLRIELLYLPPYSPNLNLIERLWGFVKRKRLYCKYYEDFKQFSSSIKECLEKTQTEYKQELQSLLSLNFQSFTKSHVMAV